MVHGKDGKDYIIEVRKKQCIIWPRESRAVFIMALVGKCQGQEGETGAAPNLQMLVCWELSEETKGSSLQFKIGMYCAYKCIQN